MMTKDELKPVMLAWLNDKEIQFQVVGEFNWIDYGLSSPNFFNSSLNWRVKPEKKLRPWKPEEVPVGAVVRDEGCKTSTYYREVQIVGRFGAWVIFARGEDHTTDYLFANNWKHSTDGGLTWKICGVEE